MMPYTAYTRPQAIESVPHRDYQLSALHRSAQPVVSGAYADGDLLFQPLSTPLSREVGRKLARSRKTEVGIHVTECTCPQGVLMSTIE